MANVQRPVLIGPAHVTCPRPEPITEAGGKHGRLYEPSGVRSTPPAEAESQPDLMAQSGEK